MNTSKYKYLQPINKIILCAGHGAGDPGAVNGNYHEANQTIFMTDIIADLLKNKGLEVEVVPHSLGLQGAINWINAKYKNINHGWAIEIHRDSAGVSSSNEISNRMGVYGGDRESMDIANGMRDILKREGGSANTWSREGIVAGVRSLGWIREPNTLSHLVECGFMQGDNSDNHLRELARRCAVAIYETFTNQTYSINNNNSDMKLQEQLNEKNAIIEKIKIGGWEKIDEISTNYPNYYDNWGRAMGNIDTLATENPYIWVREMADQISWNYTANTEVEKLKKQINDDLLETGEVKRLNNELQDTNETLAKYNKLYLDEIDKQKQEIVSKNIKISQLQEQLTSAVATPLKETWDWHKAWVGLSKNGTFTAVFGVVLTSTVGFIVKYIPALEPLQYEIIASILTFTGISITGQNAVKIIKNI